jgi:hypothetical protein
MKRILQILSLAILTSCNHSFDDLSPYYQRGSEGFVTEVLHLLFQPQIDSGDPLLLDWQCSYDFFDRNERYLDYVTIQKEAAAQSDELLEAVNDFWQQNRRIAENESADFGSEKWHGRHQILVIRPPLFQTDPKLALPEVSLLSRGLRGILYPDSPSTHMSKPGFSADGNVAILYISRYWGPLAAQGDFQVFVRRKGVWARSKWNLSGGWVA